MILLYLALPFLQPQVVFVWLIYIYIYIYIIVKFVKLDLCIKISAMKISDPSYSTSTLECEKTEHMKLSLPIQEMDVDSAADNEEMICESVEVSTDSMDSAKYCQGHTCTVPVASTALTTYSGSLVANNITLQCDIDLYEYTDKYFYNWYLR